MNFIDFIDAEISRYFIDADKEEEEETNFQNLKTSIKKSKIVEDSLDMIIFFKFVLQISNNHRRCTNFFDKIKPIIGFFVDDIKKNFSNSEIFFKVTIQFFYSLLKIKSLLLTIQSFQKLIMN